MSIREKKLEKPEQERRLAGSKTGSRTSILSRRSSGRITPDLCTDSDQLSVASRLSGLEVNPLYDEDKRRKSCSSSWKAARPYLGSSQTSLESPRSPSVSGRRGRTLRTGQGWAGLGGIRASVSVRFPGMDDADGAFITKKKFLQQWKEKPGLIIEPYNIDTEENVIHFLARSVLMPRRKSKLLSCHYFLLREGKLDVLRELCLENKGNSFVIEGLKSRDKFGQTPMLSAVSASDNRCGWPGGPTAIIRH